MCVLISACTLTCARLKLRHKVIIALLTDPPALQRRDGPRQNRANLAQEQMEVPYRDGIDNAEEQAIKVQDLHNAPVVAEMQLDQEFIDHGTKFRLNI